MAGTRLRGKSKDKRDVAADEAAGAGGSAGAGAGASVSTPMPCLALQLQAKAAAARMVNFSSAIACAVLQAEMDAARISIPVPCPELARAAVAVAAHARKITPEIGQAFPDQDEAAGPGPGSQRQRKPAQPRRSRAKGAAGDPTAGASGEPQTPVGTPGKSKRAQKRKAEEPPSDVDGSDGGSGDEGKPEGKDTSTLFVWNAFELELIASRARQDHQDGVESRPDELLEILGRTGAKQRERVKVRRKYLLMMKALQLGFEPQEKQLVVRPEVPITRKVVAALKSLPDCEGTKVDVIRFLEAHPQYSKDLDLRPTTGNSHSVPRWQRSIDNRLCKHRAIGSTGVKRDGLTVYKYYADMDVPPRMRPGSVKKSGKPSTGGVALDGK